MTKSKWDDYKQTITVLTDDQLEVLEKEADKFAEKLKSENDNLENK